MKEKFLLKDHLFNESKVLYLAQLISGAYPQFKQKTFVSEVLEKFPELELKARIGWIAEILERYLPKDFRDSSKIIMSALPPQLDPNKTDNDFGDYIFAAFGEYVVRHGLTKKIPQISTSYSARNYQAIFHGRRHAIILK